MLEAVFALARPLLNALDPEQAHELTLRSHGGRHLSAQLGDGRRPAGDERVGARVSQPARHRRGLRQGRARGRGRARHGARLRRDRHRHAATAAGQPAPARLPTGRGSARSSTGSASTTAATPRHWRGSSAGLPRGVVGINVGANKDAPDRAADYVEGIRCFYDVASYFTVNVSSPNTPGLRDLQAPAALDDLLARVLAARSQLIAAGKPRRPIVVKLAPDLAEADLEPVVGVLMARGVDGIAVGNTTLGRARRERSRSGQAGRRALGAPAVPPLDRHAGARLPADAGAHSADRHRRHRLRRRRPSPRSRPAPRCCSSTPPSCSRDRAS